MKTRLLGTALIIGLCFASVTAQDRPPRPEGDDSPPATGKKPPRGGSGKGAQQYSIEQAVSDRRSSHDRVQRAGLHHRRLRRRPSSRPARCATTSASSTCATSTRPQKGHNPMFLDRVAGNVLKIAERRAAEDVRGPRARAGAAVRAAGGEALPLIKAFYRELDGDIPAGSGAEPRAVTLRRRHLRVRCGTELPAGRDLRQDGRVAHAGAEGVPRQDEVRRLQHLARRGRWRQYKLPARHGEDRQRRLHDLRQRVLQLVRRLGRGGHLLLPGTAWHVLRRVLHEGHAGDGQARLRHQHVRDRRQRRGHSSSC